MVQIHGPISLAHGTSPSEAYKNKFATGASEILDDALGATTAYYVNAVDKPDTSGVPLKATFRRSHDVAGGHLGYHLKGGESLYLIQRARATSTFLAAGGASVIFIQVAIYDAATGAYKDTRTYEYADIYTTAPQGIVGNPVLAAGRDSVAAAFPPLTAGEAGTVFGMIRVVLDTA